MNKYQFKTTINCGGCVAKVTPHLNDEQNIRSWDVDINNPAKVLTVETETLTPHHITAMIERLGFKAEPL